MSIFYILLSLILILYGFIKIIIGLLSYSTDKIRNYFRNLPIFSFFITKDRTISAKIFDTSILIFGIYSLLHGLAMFQVFSHKINNILESRDLLYSLCIILGTFLVIFYYIVCYTKNNIEKKEEYINKYKLEGIGSGIIFLLTIPLMIFYDYYIIKTIQINTIQYIINIISIIILLIILIILIIDIHNNKWLNINIYRLITLLIIPLNIL